jgi:glycosyltransferase involved in cell wall biosynthesis
VASDARSFSEEVSFGNGAIYAQGDTVALAAELQCLLDQPDLLLERSINAQKLGQARAWPETAKQFKALFGSLVEGK